MRTSMFLVIASSLLLALGCASEGPAPDESNPPIEQAGQSESPALDTQNEPAPAECFGCNNGKEWCCTNPSKEQTCYERSCR